MTKAPTPEERRAARQAELIEEARVRAEAAKDDAGLNLPVLTDAMKDVVLLGEVAERLKAQADSLLQTTDGSVMWVGQVNTLMQLQGNLKTIGEALITHATSILEAPTA